MNKNQFRLIFNHTRSMMMAVAEHAKSHQSGQAAPIDALSTNRLFQTCGYMATVRPLCFSMFLALGMVGVLPNALSVSSARADIMADQAAPANQRPIVTNAANGVPLVNIQTPSSAGVSRNTYSQFDVGSQGVILNNSRTNVQTQLGGFVQGNPYLAAGTARVILNEVNSANPSLLNGYIEIAGSRAQLVIANPAGISCSGCGFINASAATLTTGTPIINGGDLIGYRVGGGTVHFLGAGLDASQTDYTNVLARAVDINAGIWAQNLTVVTGSNQVNVASNGVVSGMGAIASNVGSPAPALAIDVAALGGMYAGKIHLIGTEAGVGVHNAGHIGASAGEVTIDINGNLSNSNTITANTNTTITADQIINTGGRISALQQLSLQANSLTGDGSVLAGGDADITLASDYTHTSTAVMQANGSLSLSTTGNIDNQAKLLAGNTLNLSAANINNATATDSSAEISGLHTYINASNTLTNRGLIDGSDTFIAALTVNNIGSGALFGDHVAIAANTLINQDESNAAAVIAARNRLDIGASHISNSNDSLIFSAGDLFIGGNLDANHLATAQTSTLLNQAATIEALGSLNANVADLQNLNGGITTQNVLVSSTAYDQFTPRGTSVILDAANYPLWEIGNQNISWRYGATYSQPFNFREYWRYVYTGNTTETQLLNSSPAQLLSGSNMTLNGNITNSDSKIIAGGALDITGASLNNLNTQGQATTSYSGTAYYYDYDGSGGGFDYDISASAYNPANQVLSFNLPTSQVLQSTSPSSVGASTGTSVGTLVSNSLSANSLFTTTTNPTASYLIETDPRFASYRTWLSSDYMLSQLNLDPATITKRLGDGFFEQKLIREQVSQLTGQRFLAGYSNEETQYQALMVNGITFANAFNITPGVALTELQMAQLTSDIVWLVEQTVTLPDGSTTRALVPQVYAKLRDGDLNNTGSLLAGNSVKLNVTSPSSGSGQSANNSGHLFNSGSIGSRTLLTFNADTIHNLGGVISGHDVQLNAEQDINNIGGSMVAHNSLTLQAGHDINVVSTTQTSQNSTGASITSSSSGQGFSRTNLDRIAGLYVTGVQGLLAVVAGNDIHLDAAQLVNTAPTGAGDALGTGETILSAGNSINLGTVQVAEQNNSIRNAKNYIKHGSTDEIGTTIQTEGDIRLMAGNELNARAATITSNAGTLQGIAGGDINISSGEHTDNMASARYVKKSGTFSSKKTTTRDTFNNSNSIASSLSAEQIDLQSGNDLTIQGSNVVATNDVNLNASGNINIVAAQDTQDETHFKKVKQSGLSTSGASVTLGSSKLSTTNDTQTTTNVASTVGSVEGNVNINAGMVYNQTASDILTPAGDINIAAQQVNIVAGTDTYANQQTMKYKQSGITLAVSSPVISAIQTVDQMRKAASNTSDGRMQALAAGTAALSVKNATDAVIAGNTPKLDEHGLEVLDANGKNSTENPANQVGGINISISIGTSKSSSKTTQTSTTAASSHLTAGGDINITAVRAELVEGQSAYASDITIIGSQLKANDNVTLKADNQINLQAAQNVDTLNSKNKGSSASLGVSFGTDGLLFTAGASGSKGKTRGNGSTWTETVVQGGNQDGNIVKLESGTDTNLIGTQVIGNQVIANVGTSGQGDFNIQSLQDTNQYKDKQQSMGGSISVGAGRMGGSFSYSNSKTKSNYASVNEQSGIMAGDGGFEVNVNGNTNLTGAIIASTEQATNTLDANGKPINSLTTQTLTTSNIENNAEYNAKGVSIGAGVNIGITKNYQPVAGVTKSVGWGGSSDDASSVTVNGVSGGTVIITNNSAQSALAGQDAATTVAMLNRDITSKFNADAQGNITAIAVDSNGNNLASSLTPIFDQAQVQSELNAQIQITQAFDIAQQQFRLEINRKVDQAKANKEAIADMLKNQDLNEDQRLALINQGLNAQKEIEQLENMGLVFSAVAGGLSAPSNSIGGIMANSLAPEMANQIGQYFKEHGTEGSAPHILAHGVLAGAVAALGGNNPMGTALSAMGGEIAAPLVADLLYGKASDELNAEQKATVSAIASLSGVAASTSASGNINNIAQANLAAQNAVDNNWGEVGHYSTMATVLYLAGFSVKDAKAIALAAWAPDTDRRSATSSNSIGGGVFGVDDGNSKTIHLLDNEKDPVKVIATQENLAKQVSGILGYVKQIENNPAAKAAYLNTPDVQNALHSFGDAFAHVQDDGTHYTSQIGHLKDDTDPDNPNIHSDAYRNYVNTLFNVASQVSASPRVGSGTIISLVDKVTAATEKNQANALNNTIKSVISATPSSSLVKSPVNDCGTWQNCSNKPINSQAGPKINSIYGVKN